MAAVIYGIKNCDTMKKTIKWLENENIHFTFHDYRKNGIDGKMLATFVEAFGYECLVNKRGTTFRALPAATKNSLTEQSAVTLILENPSMIKRPILFYKNKYHIGFSIEQYSMIFT